MSILELLTKQLSGSNLSNLSKQIGCDEGTTQKAVAAALPTLLGAVSRNAQAGDGAASLHKALERDHDGSVLENLSGLLGGQAQSSQATNGQGILKHVLGGRQQTIEKGLSQTTGMNEVSSNKLMSMLAPAVMGAIGQQQREQKLDASGLANLLAGERAAAERSAPKEAGLMGKLLDSDGDGDVDLKDFLKHGSKLFSR